MPVAPSSTIMGDVDSCEYHRLARMSSSGRTKKASVPFAGGRIRSRADDGHNLIGARTRARAELGGNGKNEARNTFPTKLGKVPAEGRRMGCGAQVSGAVGLHPRLRRAWQ